MTVGSDPTAQMEIPRSQYPDSSVTASVGTEPSRRQQVSEFTSHQAGCLRIQVSCHRAQRDPAIPQHSSKWLQGRFICSTGKWEQLGIESEDLESGDFKLVVVTHASTLEAETGRHL